jgi:hypothetical protein
VACRGAGPQESVSRKAHRSGARLRGRSAASVRMHRRAPARGLPPAAPRLPGAACCWALAVWSLCALCSLWSLSAAAAAAAAAQANNHREHREHREHRAERRRAKGGAAAGRTASAVHGGRCGRSWRMLPGACVTGRAPIRCVDSRLGRRLWPQAMRWIRVSSAANSRPRRHRFRSRTATRGIACPGCCLLPGAPGAWSPCPPCSLWFLSAATSGAEQPRRTQGPQGRASGEPPRHRRQRRCAVGGVAFRGAGF